MSEMTTVDWIVVGGGSAGCVVARRLAEQPGARVLLIEAGSAHRPNDVGIPAAWPKLFGTRVDWAFRTTPQRHLGGREVYMPRGRALGGSSAINAQIWLHGCAADFDDWAEQVDAGWSDASLRAYFARAERATSAVHAIRGRGGRLSVNADYTPNPLSAAFVASATALGLPHRADFNAGELVGAGYCEHTRQRGRRHDVASAYLPSYRAFDASARSSPGLQVACDAVVRRVVLARGRAVGVEFKQHGKRRVVRSNAEVVL